MCTELGDIRIYDLGVDWTGFTSLPAPLRTVDLACTALAADDRGDVWAGTDNGLVRLDRDGDVLARLDARDGAPTGWVFHVYATWNESIREIWFVTGTDPTLSASAVHVFSVPR